MWRSRVFNSYKDESRDRQIGDRRLANSAERHLPGPSRSLPPGFLLTAIEVQRYKQQVTGFCSDRKDFYHQFSVSPERAASNSLPFCYSEAELWDVFSPASVCTLAWDPGVSSASRAWWTPCFRSLYQGDHMGVEFAIAAHEALLSFGGALPRNCRLLNHAAFPSGDAVQALVIDDLVSLCCLPSSADPKGPSAARDLHDAACDLYDRFEVLGSPEKDVYGETLFQAIGTEIDSRPSTVQAGIVTSAAPLARRASLALLSMRAARLPVTTPGLVARLTGAWTSTFLYPVLHGRVGRSL